MLISILMATAWLLPNHYLPWLSFHSEAWMAMVFSVFALSVFARLSREVFFTPASVFFLALMPVPICQYVFGLIYFSGEVVVYSLYLGGAAAAITLGHQLERERKYSSADLFFGAVLIGALVSVLLQLHEWLGLDWSELYVLETGNRRPSANLGQPNNLGTLLVWGLLAVFWMVRRFHLSHYIGVSLSLFIAFGLVLTESRAAFLGFFLSIIVFFLKKNAWPSVSLRKIFFSLVGGGVLLLLFWAKCDFCGVQNISGGILTFLRVEGDSPRLQALSMFCFAILERPWFGFGWNQVAQAQLLVSEMYPPLFEGWGSSHNLFLDLGLWLGLPIGALISCLVVFYFVFLYKKITTPEQVFCYCALIVGLNHSIFEFPLYYAYFLLPFGFILSASESSYFSGKLCVSRNIFGAFCLILIFVLLVLVRDYFIVEERYRELRLEWDGFKLAEKNADEAIILNQWSELIRFAHFVPYAGMSEVEIEWMVRTASFSQRPRYLLTVAKGLAINGQPIEAGHWLRTICKVSPPEQCNSAKRMWLRMTIEDSRLQIVGGEPWS